MEAAIITLLGSLIVLIVSGTAVFWERIGTIRGSHDNLNMHIDALEKDLIQFKEEIKQDIRELQRICNQIIRG